MAVEIPVVVDIEGAFKDAAARVPGASKPLVTSINRLSEDLSFFNEELRNAAAGSKDFEFAAKEVAKLEQALDLLNRRANELGTNFGSIRRLSGDLQAIEQQFSRLGATQLFDASGNLSAETKKLQQGYAKVATELDNVRSILTSEYEAQKKNSEEAERQAKATKEHQQALYMTANSLGQLQTQLAAWRAELERSQIGSNQFVNAAIQVQLLSDKIAQLNAETRIIGTNIGSIDALSARLQQLNQQYNALSATERAGATGRGLVDQYRKATKELEKEGKSLQQIIQREQKIEQIITSTTNKRKYENAVLSSTANTMRMLSEQARILQERLERARFGTKAYDDLKQKLTEVQQKMQQMGGSVTSATTAMKSQSVVLRNLTSMASMYVSVFGALRFVKQIRDVTAELEYQRISLGRLIQDEEYGAYLFEKIKAAAVESPFRIKDLVTYTKQLAAYQIEEERLFDTTKRLADISAGLGVDMNRLILAYGQVRAASVLRGQELRQFTEAGIPLVDLLAEKMGELNKTSYSTADVFKLISARAVPFSAIADIFEDLTDKGGMFYKMQEEQAKTLKGRWEKLKDTYDIALQSIGESKGLLSFKTYNDLVLGGLKALANGIRIIPKLLEGATVAWLAYTIATTKSRKAMRADAIATAENTVGKTALATAQKMGIKYTDAYSAAMVRASVASTGLGRSLWKLWAAMLANPWGAAIAGTLALVTALFSFRKNTDQSASSLVEYKKAVEDIAEAEKRYAKNKVLIEQYETLASKTEKTEEENRRLYNTMQRLNDIYPELKLGIDGENQSLEENIRLLAGKNEAEIKKARDDAKMELKAAKLNREAEKKILDQRIKDRAEAYDKMVEIRETRNVDYAPVAMKTYEKARDKFNELDEAVRETQDHISSLDESIAALDRYLHPVTEELKGWRKEVSDMNEYKTSLGTMQIFTPTEIKDMESVYDLFKQLKKIWTDAKTSMEGLEEAYAKASDTAAKSELFKELGDARALFSSVDAMRAYFGFDFKKETGGSGYTQDPFIKRMEDRIKFMKDFQKGYEDLSKYMTKQTALNKEAETMLTRGLSMGLGAEEQRRAAEDLSQWYEDTLESTFDYLKKNKGVSGSLQDFLSQQITGSSNRDKMLRDFQSLLQSLFDAKTDFDTAQLKKNMENALKKVSDELKRSETARNFYQNILDLTGDEELAATMSVNIYGGIGDDFKERMQKQLNGALEALKVSDGFEVNDEIVKAFGDMDFEKILSIADLPAEVEKTVREAYESMQKHNADWVTDLMKTYQKTKDYEERITDIKKREEQKRKEIAESTTLSDEQKASYTAASIEKENREVATVQVEALKNTYEWGKAFEDLDRVGNVTLKNLRDKLEALIETQKEFLTPEQLKALTEALEKVRTTQAQRDPLEAITSGGQRAMMIAPALKNAPGSDAFNEAIKKIKDFNKNAKETEKIDIDHLEDEFRAANKTMEEGIEGVAEYVGQWKQVVDAVSDAFNLDEVPVLGETLQGVSDALSFVATILPVIITLNGILNATLMANPFIAMAAAIIATIGAIVGLIKGLINAKVEKLNKKIEEQSELLDQLEYQYGRLEVAIEKAFGSDYIYNYNKQLENLLAQQEAYLEQANLEREKGKKSDIDKIKEYEESARDAADQIADMKTQLSEFFSGTDLTSAAEDFASAWIEAYKEFGSTTDAMSDKFNEMIESMINRSLAAKIMQEMLQPIFDQIDTLSRDGLLSTEEIASIAALAQERIPLINDAMTNLMTSLASAGLDVRTSTAGFKGISRDIAGASEESILGLAAAINTQNFYISYVPTISENVAAILSAMTGGVNPNAPVATTESGEVMPSVQQMVYDHLPNMDQNISEMLRLFRSVITTKNSSTNTNYVAVK